MKLIVPILMYMNFRKKELGTELKLLSEGLKKPWLALFAPIYWKNWDCHELPLINGLVN